MDPIGASPGPDRLTGHVRWYDEETREAWAQGDLEDYGAPAAAGHAQAREFHETLPRELGSRPDRRDQRPDGSRRARAGPVAVPGRGTPADHPGLRPGPGRARDRRRDRARLNPSRAL